MEPWLRPSRRSACWLPASGCLEFDTDRTCGEGEPSCYRDEICYQGRCYDRGEVPGSADTSERDASSGAEDSSSGSGDDVDAGQVDDSGPSDGGSGSNDTDARSTDGTSEPSDAAAPTSCSPDPDNPGFNWPEGTYCETLAQGTDSDDLCGLRQEWKKFGDDDAGSTAPPAGRPGAECSDDGECIGRCEDVGGTNEEDKRCVHRMFTSSETFYGDFASGAEATDTADFAVQEADCACQLLALRAGREGRFQAVIGDENTRAAERIEVRTDIFAIHYSQNRREWQSTTLYDRDSDPDSWANAASWENDPEFDEFGNSILDQSEDPVARVWTGHPPSKPEFDHLHCDFWSSNSDGAEGIAGNIVRSNIARFRDSSSRPACNTQNRIYCIEQ